MNTARKTFISAAVLLLLSACATADTATYRPQTGGDDMEYVAAVDHAADHAPVRVRVLWVNPPNAEE